MFTQEELEVKSLGEPLIDSPLNLSIKRGDSFANYVDDDIRIAVDVETRAGKPLDTLFFEKAGPRRRIYFDPAKTRAGIVTCGGLCPGLNNVIRSLFMELHHKYKVREVVGFRYGYEGLNPTVGLPPIRLTPSMVSHIHRQGGSVLGMGRGAQDIEVMVNTLEQEDIDILFTLGGDGTLRAAHAIAEEILRRGRKISVIGIPKTIDNDVAYVDKTFGFETAVEAAARVLDAAHTEALNARNGIGLVKLMGRDSGFIAAQSTLASNEVNFCLIPEVPFRLDGKGGLLAAIEDRLRTRGHCLIAVAEGCGATLAQGAERDASGNVRYASGSGADVGPLLRDAISKHLGAKGVPFTVKYLDPSYMLRSIPANADDSVFCDQLARHAVHAGMAGKTDLLVGRRHHKFTHMPLAAATRDRRRIDPEGSLWLAVLESTGQPHFHAPSGA